MSIPLQGVNKVRDLGIILDTKPTFSAHVSTTIAKANFWLGLLFRSFQMSLERKKCDQKALTTTYKANICPILE